MKRSQIPSDAGARFPGGRTAVMNAAGTEQHMRPRLLHPTLLGLLAIVALLVVPALASGAEQQKKPQPPRETNTGSLEQLPGRLGCVADGAAAKSVCAKA